MKQATTIFIIGVILIILGWDGFAMYKGGVGASISHTIIKWSYEFPAFTFAIGFVMGHLFWKISYFRRK